MNTSPTYDTGTPKLENLWVDPVSGDDARTGATRAEALRTLTAAWARIPQDLAEAGHGVRLLLCTGEYDHENERQLLLEDRRGTFDCPLIVQSADEPLSAELPGVHFRRCRFLYLVGVKAAAPSNDRPRSNDTVLWFSSCDDVLVRGVTAVGLKWRGGQLPGITLKANQCLRFYIEACDLSRARENTIDYVAVQHGHIVRNRLHHTLAECVYVKGGSAHHLIVGNEMSHAVNHGILAGQTTGFQYMVKPWLHYEAYDIKVVNNVIHDCGSGLAVCGGYNILLAWNTCWRVGTSRDCVVVGLGGRGWIGSRPDNVDDYFRAGGWCHPSGELSFNIPNRNVLIANNVILNPDGFESRLAHFGISGPVQTPAGSNLPNPARADENLRIGGNVIWNGPPDKPLLDDVEDVYHLAAKPTIDPDLLVTHNTINTVRPDLVDPEHGDFRPVPGGSLCRQRAVPIPDFDWTDAPTEPPVPRGNLDNHVPFDRDGRTRDDDAPPGAYV